MSPRSRRHLVRRDDDDVRGAQDLSVGVVGVDEETVLPWPLVMRQRVRSRMEGSDRYAWLVTAVVLFGMLTVTISITILAVNITTIARDLDSNKSVLTWVIAGPTLAGAILGTTAGKLGDLYGHRRVNLVGLGGAAVFSVACALAWSASSLVGFRILSATLGAATGPTSMAIINLLFPREQRARALGYWSMVVAGGPVIGLVAGGFIVEAVGWRAIFWIQAPMLAASAAAGFLLLPETPRRTDTHFDLVGQVLLGLGILGILLPVNQAPNWGWASPAVLGAFALAVVLIAAFVLWERRVEHPLVPLKYFGRRNFAFPMAVQFFTNFAYMGGFILAPQLLQEVRGLASDQTSLLMIPRPLTFAIVGPVAGYLAVKVGERASAVVGNACIALSMLGLAVISHNPSNLGMIIALALSGAGLGAAAPSLAATLANAVDDQDLGIAGAAQQLVSQVGVSLGTTLLVTIQVSAADRGSLSGSYALAFGVGATVCLVGVVLSAFIRSTRHIDDHGPADPALAT